jgi:hypothetical protein
VLGYGFKDDGQGGFGTLLDADLALVDASGTTVARKDKFVSIGHSSHDKVLESDLAFKVTLSAFEPGGYTLHFTVHDEVSGKATTFDVPVTLLAGDAASASQPASDASSADIAASASGASQ